MIITLSWISILLGFVIAYLILNGSMKNHLPEIMIMGFIAMFFVVIDYQTTELGTELQKLNTITHETKYCDVSMIYQKCWTNTTYEVDASNNTRLQEYIALRDSQHELLGIISKLIFGLLIIFLGYITLNYIRMIGLVK